MNTTESTIPPIPDNRFNLQPLTGARHPFAILDALLKTPGRILHETRSGRAAVFVSLAIIVCVSMVLYGSVVGSQSGGNQLFIAPAKMLLGSLLCLLICLPSLYIFLCLNGSDINLRTVAGELLAATGLTALLLLAFAPVAWVFSQSTDSIALMAVLHLIFWVIALFFGLRLLGRSSPGQRSGYLSVWIVIYLVVCLQMMTTLRPLIGSAETFLPNQKKFFLVHALETLGGPTGKK